MARDPAATETEVIVIENHSQDRLERFDGPLVREELGRNHIALRRGCDVDQPRNLAKSVTVE